MIINENPIVALILRDEDEENLKKLFFGEKDDVNVNLEDGSLKSFLEVKGYCVYETLEWIVNWIFSFEDESYKGLDGFEEIKIYDVETNLEGLVKGFRFVYDSKTYSYVISLDEIVIAIYQNPEEVIK